MSLCACMAVIWTVGLQIHLVWPHLLLHGVTRYHWYRQHYTSNILQMIYIYIMHFHHNCLACIRVMSTEISWVFINTFHLIFESGFCLSIISPSGFRWVYTQCMHAYIYARHAMIYIPCHIIYHTTSYTIPHDIPYKNIPHTIQHHAMPHSIANSIPHHGMPHSIPHHAT